MLSLPERRHNRERYCFGNGFLSELRHSYLQVARFERSQIWFKFMRWKRVKYVFFIVWTNNVAWWELGQFTCARMKGSWAWWPIPRRGCTWCGRSLTFWRLCPLNKLRVSVFILKETQMTYCSATWLWSHRRTWRRTSSSCPLIGSSSPVCSSTCRACSLAPEQESLISQSSESLSTYLNAVALTGSLLGWAELWWGWSLAAVDVGIHAILVNDHLIVGKGAGYRLKALLFDSDKKNLSLTQKGEIAEQFHFDLET